jgi:asparagine synthase (glutamine-hydrolysing)
MSGFAGIFGKRADGTSRRELECMMARIAHKPCPAYNHVSNDSFGVEIAWAPGGTPDGVTQVWNAERSITLILRGEEFGTRCGNGSTTAGAEMAARHIGAYEAEGIRFIGDLNGWFSGILIDYRAGTAVLFNDRYGLSRVYYHESPHGFFFASEAKALLNVLPQLRQIDQQSLAEFVSLGCVLQNRSLFKGVSLLPGASAWTFSQNDRIEKRCYFNFASWEEQEKLSPRAYTEQLITAFARIAPRYLTSDQPAAMSLTGGLDSRMILAFARAVPGTLPCYTFAGPYRDCADVRIARRLATLCRQPHTTISIGADFFEEFPTLAEKTVYFSDGAMDVSGAVELYVNRIARQIAPVRITGNYGSEILRSNVAFGPRALDQSIFTAEFNGLLKGAAETYRSESAGNRLSFIASKQVPWHHFARLAVEKSQITPRSPFLDNELVALAYRAPTELASSPDPQLEVIAAGDSSLSSVNTDRALRQKSIPLLQGVAKIWHEFTAKAEYAYDYGMPGWLTQVDRFFGWLHAERLFLGRHKFYHFRIWYRHQLSDHLRNSIASNQTPACYRPEAAQTLVRDHVTGRANHTMALHKLLTIQLIERLFVRQA